MFKIIEINSAQNVRYKSWLKLLDGRGIKKAGEAILSGKKFLQEVLAAYPERVLGILVREEDEIAPFIDEGVTLENLPLLYVLSRELFAELDIYGTDAPLLVISAPEPPVWDPWADGVPEGLTLFLPFQNPINLGTIIRSAAALGARVVVLKEAANIYHPKTLRAAGPAIFQTQIFQGPALAELVKYEELPLYALSPRGANLFNFEFPKSLGLVAGMEGPGLGDIWPVERLVSIPMQKGVESLNAAASVDMAMGYLFAAWQKF